MAALERLLQRGPLPDEELRKALVAELPLWRQNWRAAIPTLTLARTTVSYRVVLGLAEVSWVLNLATSIYRYATSNLSPRKALSRSKHAKTAMKVLEIMSAAGVTITAVHISMVVKACETSRLWQSALELLEKSARDAVQIDVVVCNACIGACKVAAQWEEAWQLLRDICMSALRCNERSYSAAISACERAGQWQSALCILRRIRQSQAQCDAFACTAAISACGRTGQWQMSLELMQCMVAERLGPVEASLNAVITACGNAAAWQQSLQVLELTCQLLSPSSVTFNAASFACGEAGCWQLSLQLLGQMPGHKAQPDQASFNTAITACGRGAEWQKALELLQRASSKHLDPVSVAAATAACDMGGQWQAAMSLLDLSVRGKAISGPCFTSAISSCEHSGNWEAALWIFTRMNEHCLQQEARSFGAVLNACVCGDAWEWALELLSSLMTKRLRPQGSHVGSITAILERTKGAAEAQKFLQGYRTIWSLDDLPAEDSQRRAKTSAAVTKLAGSLPGLELLATGCSIFAVSKPAGRVVGEFRRFLHFHLQRPSLL